MKKILTLCLLTSLFLPYTSFAQTMDKIKINKKHSTLKVNKTNIKKFIIKAGVIKGDGNIIPVARRIITITPYTRIEIDKLEEKLVKKNNVGDKPSIKEKLDTEIAKLYYVDYEEWKKEASKELVIEIAKLSGNKKTYHFRTDLSGEVNVEIPKGFWYITTTTITSSPYVYWIHVPITVDDKLEKFELSNDNATEIFNN